MCFIESDWVLHKHTFSRRQLLETGLAAGLAATTGLAGGAQASSLLPGLAVGAQAPPRSGGPGTSRVRFTWFGTNGWEITFGNKTILVDPWFVRSDVGFFSGKFNASAPLQVTESLINQHITRADQILVGHGHWDHIMEIPFIAKKTGAQVIGSETHANIMRAFGVEEGKHPPSPPTRRTRSGPGRQYAPQGTNFIGPIDGCGDRVRCPYVGDAVARTFCYRQAR